MSPSLMQEQQIKEALGIRQKEEELLQQQQAEEDKKAAEDRAYISRDIGKEAAAYRNGMVKSDGVGGAIKRALLGMMEGAARYRDPKYQGIEETQRQKLLDEYKIQAPLRQRDVAAYESNITRRENNKLTNTTKVLNNQRAASLKIAEMAEKMQVDKALIEKWAVSNENVLKAIRLGDEKLTQMAIETEYMKTHGSKMGTTPALAALGQAVEKDPNQVYLGLMAQRAAKSGTSPGGTSRSVTTTPDRRMIGGNLVELAPKVSVRETTKPGFAPGEDPMSQFRNMILGQQKTQEGTNVLGAPILNQTGQLNPTKPAPIRSSKTPVVNTLPGTQSVINKNITPKVDSMGNRILAEKGPERIKIKQEDLEQVTTMARLSSDGVQAIQDIGIDGLSKFIGKYGLGKKSVQEIRAQLGKNTYEETLFNSLFDEQSWNTALLKSGKAINATEIAYLQKIVPSSSDTRIENVIQKAVLRAMASSVLAGRLAMLQEGKLSYSDIQAMDMRSDILKATKYYTAAIMSGQKFSKDDFSASVLYPDVEYPTSKNRTKSYWSHANKRFQDGEKKLSGPVPQQGGGSIDYIKKMFGLQ